MGPGSRGPSRSSWICKDVTLSESLPLQPAQGGCSLPPWDLGSWGGFPHSCPSPSSRLFGPAPSPVSVWGSGEAELGDQSHCWVLSPCRRAGRGDKGRLEGAAGSGVGPLERGKKRENSPLLCTRVYTPSFADACVRTLLCTCTPVHSLLCTCVCMHPPLPACAFVYHPLQEPPCSGENPPGSCPPAAQTSFWPGPDAVQGSRLGLVPEASLVQVPGGGCTEQAHPGC